MANYTCYAINQMIGGRQSVDQESFMVYVQSEGKATYFECHKNGKVLLLDTF